MFRYTVMWYLFKFKIISYERWLEYTMDLTMKIIKDNQDTFIRLKDS